MKGKKGALDLGILTLAGIIIALLFLAPIIMKVVKEPVDKFRTAIGNQSAVAGSAVQSVETGFTNLWDTIIIIAFLVSVLMLFISAFLVDVHPAFVILYILLAGFTLIFAPQILDAVENIWNAGEFAEAVALLPFTNFLLNNFSMILLGIIFLSGIIMYAKFKYGMSGGMR